MERDTGTGKLQHTKVIGAVADGHGVIGGDTELFGYVVQRVHLGLLTEDGLFDEAGQDALFLQQDICPILVEAEVAPILLVKTVKPPETRAA